MITKNSKNKLIHPTQDGIENFWKWFGDSKVVDEQGRPLVMYHGTRWEFNQFEKNKQGKSIDCPWSNFGFFFTEDYELASKFSKGKKWNTNYKYLKGSNVLPVYLSMKNPYHLKAHIAIRLSGSVSSVFNLKNDCISNGHDGIIIGTWKDSFDTPDMIDGELNYPQYIVFSPEQIKSAIGNTGTFDPKNSNLSENNQSNMKNIKNFKDFVNEGMWMKDTFIPVTSKDQLNLYYGCSRCGYPSLSFNKKLTNCLHCNNDKIYPIDENEFYRIMKIKLGPIYFKELLKLRKGDHDANIDLMKLGGPDPEKLRIN